MVDFDNILEVVPHYLVMLILIFLVLAGVRLTAGELSFWIEFVLVLIVTLAYPPLVRRMNIAPNSWKKTDNSGKY